MSFSRTAIASASILFVAVLVLPAGAQYRAIIGPVSSAPAARTTTYTIDQFLSPASPLEVSAARKADRVAWVPYERGMRNVYVASAPELKTVRITKFLADHRLHV